MTDARLQTSIEKAFEERARITPQTKGETREAVEAALELLDSGKARVAEKLPGATGPNSWKVNQWLKKAVLLSFRLNDNALVKGGPGEATWWDKIPSKFESWGQNRFKEAGFRAVPGAIVRRSAFIARDVVLMPSFVNLGAFVDEKTMVDTWVTVGSCAQIGKNVHLSGGVGIGGVLEPLQANPTIIEDDCFIGARSEVVEGVIVGQGSVLSMGVDGLDDHRTVERGPRRSVGQGLAGQRAGDDDRIGRHMADMDLASRAVDDLGRSGDEDAHRQDRSLADDHALDHFRARADEAVILDDGRVGLQGLEHAADSDAAGEVHVLADLRA